MDRKWLAKKYTYADGIPWNQDRWLLFVWSEEKGDWVHVGGAMKTWSLRTIAWICDMNTERRIASPHTAEELTPIHVWGQSVKDALLAVKAACPNPDIALREMHDHQMAAF